MSDRVLIQKMAIERCKLYASHIMAMSHQGYDSSQILGVVENLNKDFLLIEGLICEES